MDRIRRKRSLALEWLHFVQTDANESDAFLLVDYPGYGWSEGYASLVTNRAAVDGALDALEKHLRDETHQIAGRLNVIGHSFGAAAALDFASRHRVQRVVLIAPFTSLQEEGAVRFGFLSHLLIENYDNRARLDELGKLTDPPRVAIFHGTSDDIIPVQMGRDLAATHATFVQFFPLENADHLSPIFKHASEIFAWMND